MIVEKGFTPDQNASYSVIDNVNVIFYPGFASENRTIFALFVDSSRKCFDVSVENLVAQSVAASSATPAKFTETLEEGDEMFEVFSDVANMNADFVGQSILEF